MRREAVSLLGLAALVSGTIAGGMIARPNRVAAGTHVSLWSLGGTSSLVIAVALAIVTAGLVACVLVPALRDRPARLVVATMLVPVLALMIAAGSRDALVAAGFPGGRVSPGAGWWAATIGAYLVIYDARRRTARSTSGARAARLVSTSILILSLALLFVVRFDGLGVVQEFLNRRARFVAELGAHVALTASSVVIATAIGVPLGMLAFRSKRGERPIFTITNGLQTIPSLALFGLMIAPLAFLSRHVPILRAVGIRGVGNAPAIIALVLYGLLPIVRNTYVGLKSVDRGVQDAGRGMGMSRAQLLWLVQVPVALPIVLTGIRVTAVQTVGTAAVAALIGARGLGNFVFQGLGQAAPDLIVLGVIPIVVLAVIIDRAMDALVRALRPGAKEER